jgi:hypothetical protein
MPRDVTKGSGVFFDRWRDRNWIFACAKKTPDPIEPNLQEHCTFLLQLGHLEKLLVAFFLRFRRFPWHRLYAPASQLVILIGAAYRDTRGAHCSARLPHLVQLGCVHIMQFVRLSPLAVLR